MSPEHTDEQAIELARLEYDRSEGNLSTSTYMDLAARGFLVDELIQSFGDIE